MKTLNLTKTLLIVGAALAFSPGARASLTNFTSLSLGGTTAGWDLFYGANNLPTFTFATGTAGNPITNAGSNLDLVANVPGYDFAGNAYATGPTGSNFMTIPGDRELFYTRTAPSVNFHITSQVAAGDVLTSFTFQSLTATGSAGGLTGIQLNGLSATSSGTNGSGVNFWTWTGLNLSAGSTVALTFNATSSHSAFDGFQVQSDAVLTAVPEPSVTAAAVGLALAGLVLLRRRKAAKT